MRLRPKWWRPYITHAAKVAVVASVIISALYVCLVATFDGFDRHRQVVHVDAQLEERLDQATHVPSRAGDAVALTRRTTPTMHRCSFGRPRWPAADRPDRRHAGAGDLGRAAQWPSVGGAPRCRDVSVTGSTDCRRGVCRGAESRRSRSRGKRSSPSRSWPGHYASSPSSSGRFSLASRPPVLSNSPADASSSSPPTPLMIARRQCH